MEAASVRIAPIALKHVERVWRAIEAAIAAVWRRGFLRIELSVNAGNERALGLYQRVGFVEEGRFRQAARLGAAYVDVIPMALLAPAMLGEGQD